MECSEERNEQSTCCLLCLLYVMMKPTIQLQSLLIMFCLKHCQIYTTLNLHKTWAKQNHKKSFFIRLFCFPSSFSLFFLSLSRHPAVVASFVWRPEIRQVWNIQYHTKNIDRNLKLSGKSENNATRITRNSKNCMYNPFKQPRPRWTARLVRMWQLFFGRTKYGRRWTFNIAPDVQVRNVSQHWI